MCDENKSAVKLPTAEEIRSAFLLLSTCGVQMAVVSESGDVFVDEDEIVDFILHNDDFEADLAGVEVEQWQAYRAELERTEGAGIQCAHIRKNGKRCGNMVAGIYSVQDYQPGVNYRCHIHS